MTPLYDFSWVKMFLIKHAEGDDVNSSRADIWDELVALLIHLNYTSFWTNMGNGHSDHKIGILIPCN